MTYNIYTTNIQGFNIKCYSPIKRSMSENDNSREVICGSFKFKLPNGSPAQLNATITTRCIIASLKRSHRCQEKNGYGSNTPALLLLMKNRNMKIGERFSK